MKCHVDTGTVVQITDRTAIIRLDHEPEGGCGGGCACSRLAGGAHSVEVDKDGLKVDDRVRVSLPQANAYVGMLLLFGLPVVLFWVGLLGGRAIGGGPGSGSWAVGGAVGGLVVAFAIASVVNGLITRGAKTEVWRLEDEDDAGEADPAEPHRHC